MFISINWIKDFVNLDGIDIDNLINKFTMSTAEVEQTIKYGYNTQGVVVGKVVELVQSEFSDKLKIAKIDVGDKIYQSVCSAPNIKKGMIIAFAKAGGIVNGVHINETEINSIKSEGMCLSEKELGISDDHSGVMVLDKDLKLGTNIKEILDIEDVIFEVDNKSLTNRPDLWGHYGIAREIAAITKRELKPLDVEDLAIYNDLEKVKINIENADDCYRYSSICVENITRKISPINMRIRLYYCGLRSINFLADLTNYLMLETSQPMHAFDRELVKEINVKRLGEKQQFITLDNIVRELDENVLMICNQDRPIGIAGIMGGANTQITDETNKLLLESANFNSVLIRKTSVNIAHRTDASARYEKTLDPELTTIAIARFIKLLKIYDSEAKVTSSLSDVYLKKYPKIIIDINKKYIDRKIGIDISIERILDILNSLEYKVKVDGEEFNIEVPSFRATKDVTQKADIIEEISRIYGYDNIEPKTNFWPTKPVALDEVHRLEYDVKKNLAEKYNMSEIHSYVWYDSKLNKELNIQVDDNLKIVNALNKEDSTLRRTMAPTLLYYTYKNIKYFDECSIFEIGRTFEYHFDNKNCIENKVLGIATSSNKKSDKELLLSMKNIIENIVNINKNISIKFVDNNDLDYSWLHPVNTFKIMVDKVELGYVTLVHPKIIENMKSKLSICICEIDIEKLADINTPKVIYEPISKFQTVTFDLSLILDKKEKYELVKEAVKKANLEYFRNLELIDIYEDSEKLKDKKNLTIRITIGSNEKTLVKEEIEHQREKVLNELNKNNITLNM